MKTIMNRENNQKGFTLIELIMVIVILGILAAVAVPKFVDLKADAKKSVSKGVTGAIRGAVVTLHAQYVLNSASTYDGISIAAAVDSDLTIGGTATQVSTTIDGGTCTWTIGTPTTSVMASVSSGSCS